MEKMKNEYRAGYQKAEYSKNAMTLSEPTTSRRLTLTPHSPVPFYNAVRRVIVTPHAIFPPSPLSSLSA